MSIRSSKRFMAKEMMKDKGYEKICKPKRGEPKKGRWKKKKHMPIGSGSFFASLWRNATALKNQKKRK